MLLNSCKKDKINIDQSSSYTQQRNITAFYFYALGENNTLDKYNASAEDQLLQSTTISGLQFMEKIMLIDFRPATGEM